MTLTLEIKDLRVLYHGHHFLLGPLDLSLDRGLVAVLGRNGSGKSTLLRTLAGIQESTSFLGSVQLCERPLNSLSARERALLCTWSDSRGECEADWTVRDLVLLGRYPQHLGYPTAADHIKVERTLELLGIQGFGDRFVTELSSGFQQKVWLAKALAVEAPILVLDEPTTHLDAGASWEFMELLRNLSKNELHPTRLILCVTHDLHLAKEFCDRLLGLVEGRLVLNTLSAQTSDREIREQLFARAGVAKL